MIDYLIVFLTVIVVNVVPFLMPPTWLVLAFFYNNFIFDAGLLALTGAVASTSGRAMLSYLGTYFRRFAGRERKRDMELVGRIARQHPIKSFLFTLLFSLSPFPSNVYFLGVGLAKARNAAIFAGFFIGRLISYYLLIRTAQIIFNSLGDIFASKLLQVIVIDLAGIAAMLLFLMVDWSLLVKKRKLKFVPLKMPWTRRKRVRGGKK